MMIWNDVAHIWFNHKKMEKEKENIKTEEENWIRWNNKQDESVIMMILKKSKWWRNYSFLVTKKQFWFDEARG